MVLGRFTSGYCTANTGLITRDLAQIRAFAKKEISRPNIDQKLNLKNFLNSEFALNKASSKVFGLLLATRKPRSLLDGTTIDTFRALSVTNKLEYHHIFPKAYLGKLEISEKEINQHTNICMLNLSNNRQISASKPSEYFKKISEMLGDKLTPVLQSNFINRQAYEAALANDFDAFRKIRSEELSEDIKVLVSEDVI